MGLSHLTTCPTRCYDMGMESSILKGGTFRRIAANVKPDAKKRVVISRAPAGEGVTYHVYANEIGQIILDPQVSIPASEAWLYQDKEARDAVIAGLREAVAGKTSRVDLKSL